eukprot:CAMPEP_0172867758 /NCGR_PEP_ID=MMETSP1075-20121228/84508_1 /TAXON_ID=2916 /ORGANISM="Ceratium fusus, Strain PA161109" /LENGTH=127 /DNA_ID=CAMNT_0013717201 /DNA_START=12 /DNA_END=395 /DNA_ORIENTATION=-
MCTIPSPGGASLILSGCCFSPASFFFFVRRFRRGRLAATVVAPWLWLVAAAVPASPGAEGFEAGVVEVAVSTEIAVRVSPSAARRARVAVRALMSALSPVAAWSAIKAARAASIATCGVTDAISKEG